MEKEYSHIVHPIPPLYDENSKVLVLGSFPSVKSRESGFFYGHPQNRFWKMMGILFRENAPGSVMEKADFLRRHGIAAWDTIGSCDIVGSSDSSIRNVKVNDIRVILRTADIREIYCNGRKSYELYMRYLKELTGREAKLMPSTSPANAACGMEKLIAAWSDLLKYCI